MSENSQVIFDYIFSLTGSDVKLEMSRVHQFMDKLGHPHRAYPVLHIAGTNGKGSTAAILAAILRGYGFKVGLFTSPHLMVPNERIRVNEHLVPDDFIVAKVNEWRGVIEELGITFFEVLTALGMCYFKEQAVDYCVLETGLGGRLDATNVVDPLLSLITSISMDHENILGDTIEAICYEKAGIIKADRPVILARNKPVIQGIIAKVSQERHAPYKFVPDLIQARSLGRILGQQRLEIQMDTVSMEFLLPLLGSHQLDNFCNALVALTSMGLDLDPEKIQDGLDQLQWAGRMEVLRSEPLVFYDVAHNPDGLTRLMESLKELGMGHAILIPAFNARKDIREMIYLLRKWDGPVMYTLFHGHSSVDAEKLGSYGISREEIFPSPSEALAQALKIQKADQPLCFFGSHYLAEEIYALFGVDHLSPTLNVT
jgi:dihydrofolate synthase/folylpolyglutamate synthase